MNNHMKMAVLGSGSWGTALSLVLADNHIEVNLWGHNPAIIDEINEQHSNTTYLPNVELPSLIKGYSDLEEALKEVNTILLTVPTKAIRDIVKKVSKLLINPVTIIHASKGIEPGTYKRISEMIKEEMPSHLLTEVVVLSGPSHAEEVSLRQPTTVTAAASQLKVAEYVQKLFMNANFRVPYLDKKIIPS